MDSMPAPLCCARALRARRRAQRGAAFVEALVAISFFIVIFAGTTFLGQVYGGKLRTLRDSREEAWTGATRGCSRDGSGVTGGGSNTESAGNIDLGPAKGAPGTGGLFDSGSHIVSTRTVQVRASFAVGGYSRNITSTTRVECNEQRQNSDPLSIAKHIFGAFKPHS